MRRTALNKTSKLPISKIQKLLWVECRRIAGEQFANPNGSVNCFTCPARNLQGSNRQLGHGPWPKASLGAFLKYDVFRCLRWQCSTCNIFRGGMGAEFYKRLLREEGPEFMKQLERDRNVTVKAYDWYVKLLAEYKEIKL